jgi:hypothetical protein
VPVPMLLNCEKAELVQLPAFAKCAGAFGIGNTHITTIIAPKGNVSLIIFSTTIF